jgi:hypothetical protein
MILANLKQPGLQTLLHVVQILGRIGNCLNAKEILTYYTQGTLTCLHKFECLGAEVGTLSPGIPVLMDLREEHLGLRIVLKNVLQWKNMNFSIFHLWRTV